ncbi:hypothetical protein J4466_01270 [Candidatus Pacearchaeota archaeon]|nr:hypothetical protein [Candidatus Pacearchaeota archaeon]
MKSVFIAGSRRFYNEIKNLANDLNKNKVMTSTAGEYNSSKKDTLTSEKRALLSAFDKIRKSDLLYVYSKKGYIGKTVAMEIAFAYCLKKEIIAYDIIEEFSAQALVSKVLKPKELMEYCRKN